MFFGREDVLQKLDALLGKHVASLVTCRGRRIFFGNRPVPQVAWRLKSPPTAKFVKVGFEPDGKKKSLSLKKILVYGNKSAGCFALYECMNVDPLTARRIMVKYKA